MRYGPVHFALIYLILNKLIKSSGKCNSKSTESNTFYKYEFENTICELYKTQTGFCK